MQAHRDNVIEMTAWEYTICTIATRNRIHTLNKMGGNGWELVAIKGDEYFFRRPKDVSLPDGYKRGKE